MESIIVLNDAELEVIIKKAIGEYKRQEEAKKKKDKYHDTYELMKIYRDVAIHIERSISEAEQLKIEGMSDKQKKVFLNSVRESKVRSMLMTTHIDVMVKEIEERRKREGREKEYQAFELYFFNGMTYDEIAEKLECGNNTPRRWVSGVLRELSPLIWGYDALPA
ncbi:sigma-70 region 4 domain-containing protein [Diplocloster modestus]|uniref:Sigma-70 region 4 domain-containing protein n=1 Tax=Diplocloster modestus TaxID=2850322 RepID=A0ABS6KCP4_9FIRM|nr:sigma-70 region 4 domain-containing protein [Diplocloster modestus]